MWVAGENTDVVRMHIHRGLSRVREFPNQTCRQDHGSGRGMFDEMSPILEAARSLRVIRPPSLQPREQNL
jgi:hypothetical protein